MQNSEDTLESPQVAVDELIAHGLRRYRNQHFRRNHRVKHSCGFYGTRHVLAFGDSAVQLRECIDFCSVRARVDDDIGAAQRLILFVESACAS